MRPPHRLAGLLGAIFVSLIVLVGFVAICTVVLNKAIPTENREVALVLLGALASMATNVVGYWIGSSMGSQHKDALLARDGEKQP